MPGDTAITRLREKLDRDRARFLELKPKLEDPKRLRVLLLELRGFLDPIMQIGQDSPPHSAMFAVGQVQGGIDSVYEDIHFYNDYIINQATLEQLVNDESRRDEEHSADPTRSIQAAVT